MNHNITHQPPRAQIRSFYKMGHPEFSRLFKARHDADTIELLAHMKQLRHLLFIHGVNPAQTDALLKKHGA